jgi:sRNA-binding carbon storage regulator CsrA
MLVLSRQANQSIQIGDSITLTVERISPHDAATYGALLRIDGANCNVILDGGSTAFIESGKSFFLNDSPDSVVTINDNIEIAVEWLNHCDIKLRISAPRDVKILRSELVNKGHSESPEALSRIKDRFAGLAMQAALNTAWTHSKSAVALSVAAGEAGRSDVEQIAHTAYEIAEAMMTERQRRK